MVDYSKIRYIKAVKRALRDQHGFIPTGGPEDDPTFSGIPDGDYQVIIDGYIDTVEIVGDSMRFCRYHPYPTDKKRDGPAYHAISR